MIIFIEFFLVRVVPTSTKITKNAKLYVVNDIKRIKNLHGVSFKIFTQTFFPKQTNVAHFRKLYSKPDTLQKLRFEIEGVVKVLIQICIFKKFFTIKICFFMIGFITQINILKKFSLQNSAFSQKQKTQICFFEVSMTIQLNILNQNVIFRLPNLIDSKIF